MPVPGFDYYVGQSKTFEFSFVDANNAPVDPSTVTVRIGVYVSERMVQTLATYTAGQLTHPGTGVYQKVYVFPQAGKFLVEVTTTGTPTTVETEELTVGVQPTWLP